MTFYHLTENADFQLDPEAPVLGWGAKNCAPCEIMYGVLYVAAPEVTRWQHGHWAGRRSHLAIIEIADSAREGIDLVTLSDTETLILNLDVATMVAVEARQKEAA